MMDAASPHDRRAIARAGRAAVEITPASAPDARKPGALPTAVAEHRAPAILRVAHAAEITDAATLGGNFLLLADDALLDPARAAGLGLLREISVDRAAPGDALLEEHPDWFVHGKRGPVFRHLSDTDATVDWWEAELARLLDAGYAGFYCRDAHLTAPAVWARLRGAARRPDIMFIAECFGATPAEILDLSGLGFDFVVSSSCWWDFSQSWLNEDAARISPIGPAIAWAAPPGTTGWTRTAAIRALRFAATYAPGWLVEARFLSSPGDDLRAEVARLNALRHARRELRAEVPAKLRSSPGARLAVLERRGFIITANASLEHEVTQPGAAILPVLGAARLQTLGETAAEITPDGAVTLAPGGVCFFTRAEPEPVVLPPAENPDCRAPRIAIEAITPQVDNGRYPVRHTVGELVTIEADLIADGHGKLAGEVLVRPADEGKTQAYPLMLIANDRWRALVPLERMGRYVYTVSAWQDAFASFAHEVREKHAAGVPTRLELQEGLALVAEAAPGHDSLSAMLARLQDLPEDELRTMLLSDMMVARMRQAAPRKFLVTSHEIIVDAERRSASFASWYEIFPRSQSGDPARHGTFKDVIGQLPRIAAMNFDVLYFPPIHPIGEINRKGRNNALQAGPSDPGSPYAIGSKEGGHDALHPELGTVHDFRALVAAAKDHGLEVALDFAIQCAPDHPWVTEHPEWFDWRPDGSLRYAENPPKKYEDIVNVDFYTEGAQPSLWIALRDVVQFWVDQGIRLFRVDNPHTKPFPFWEWMIADIRARHPDTVFLAEAFTRPKVMYRLAKIGFSQSYTYFTWRNTKTEIQDYLTELTTTAPKDFFRPHFFVNTPDINPVFLQTSGRGGFLIRAALATTLSGLWGMYNGFELCEAQPVPGKEEYLNSEKYEIKAWDCDRKGNIVAEISQLNRIRRANAALHSHLNVEFLPCDNPQVVYFRKFASDGNTLLIAISLDPLNVQDATIELPLWRLGLPDNGMLAAEDLMRAQKFVWSGKFQPVRLNPFEQPFCIWRVTSADQG
ncbi:alpha-1,4-glucan--maltose-1-phosphate maltosyltransferase [Acidocella sp.]|jgi:starch synthase (maltosyl-transferring)|uniref:alpha-1,4-glucan--maltose-1-phosphate maltosyltransferase n=1 Tax=Acidocella sp. TaxID=50710 RepID=UPI002F406F1A